MARLSRVFGDFFLTLTLNPCYMDAPGLWGYPA